MEKSWFELRSHTKRTYSQSVWVPLHVSYSRKMGHSGAPGYSEEYEGAHSIIVPLEKRELGEKYSWSDSHECRPWATKKFYTPADAYMLNEEVEVGFRLVLRQSISGQPNATWHLNQDFVIALELLQEGDSWIRPAEDYVEVARLRRDPDGTPAGIEVRSEFLRDYLCARNCALRIASYRERVGILAELGDIDFPQEGCSEEINGGRLEERAWAIDSSGSPFGSSVGVFRVSRNDVDSEDDVPVMGPETNDNVETENWSFTREGEKFFRVMAEFWRDEWIEPAANSLRVRNDKVASQVTYIIDADGTRQNADDLNDEDIGRWLWFNPNVVNGLLARRGGRLAWYTRDTGGLFTPANPSVHFGLNDSGLITVYARDIARLPEWERRFWAGFNVSPEGKVSSELLQAQVRAQVAKSQSPEQFFPIVLEQLSSAWASRFGSAIFRAHDQVDEIAARVHRFRALNRPGLLSLAKDVARLTADAINADAAQEVAPPPKGERRGSLKSFEAALATVCGPHWAHKVMGPLFGIYELRISDAHLPKSDMESAFKLMDISDEDTHLNAGYKLLHSAVSSLNACQLILRDQFPPLNQSKE
jgi:hypothetical protein